MTDLTTFLFRDAATKTERAVKLRRDPTTEKDSAIMESMADIMHSSYLRLPAPAQATRKLFGAEMDEARGLLHAAQPAQALGVLFALFLNLEGLDDWFEHDRKATEATFEAFYSVMSEVLQHDDATLCLTGRDVLIDGMIELGNKVKASVDLEFQWFTRQET